KSVVGNNVLVRFRPGAPRFALTGYAWRGHAKTVRAERVRRSRSAAEAKTDRLQPRPGNTSLGTGRRCCFGNGFGDERHVASSRSPVQVSTNMPPSAQR